MECRWTGSIRPRSEVAVLPCRLEHFAGYVPEETSRISRLAISGVWDTPRQPVGGPGPYTTVPPGSAFLKSTVKRGVRLYGGLEELCVWPQEARTYKPVRGTKAERVSGEIVEFLAREKENSPEWVREFTICYNHN
jgi:hypothetical protein